MPYGAILGQKADGYTQEETLSNTTKTLYGLQNTATPDDVFQTINADIEENTSNINSINSKINSVQKVSTFQQLMTGRLI